MGFGGNMNKAEVVALIRSVLSSSKTSPTVACLNSEFKKETGIDIPLFGYQKLNDFLHSIPDTVKVIGSYPLQRVSLITNEKSAHIVSLVKRQKNRDTKNISFFKNKTFTPKIETKTRIVKSQSDTFSSNIACKKVSETSSFSEIEAGFAAPFNRVVKEEPQNLPSVIEENIGTESDLNLPVPLHITKKNFCLLNDMVVNQTVPIINVRHHARVNEYIEVRPCHIKSPYMFYFHFRKFKKIFKVLVKKLNNFYSAGSEGIPSLPNELIRPGQLCIVPFKIEDRPMWGRAEIIKDANKSEVIVSLVDYGNTAAILRDDLKIFHRGFLSVPKQAVQGYLANIKPLAGDSKWSPKVTRRFNYFALRNDLIGGVTDISTEADSGGWRIGLALTDTKGGEIHINDTLVNEGYAEFHFHHEKSSINSCDVRLKTTKHIETFIEDLIENTNKKLLNSGNLRPCKLSPTNTQVFYFPNFCNENVRLRKLFSVSTEN